MATPANIKPLESSTVGQARLHQHQFPVAGVAVSCWEPRGALTALPFLWSCRDPSRHTDFSISVRYISRQHCSWIKRRQISGCISPSSGLWKKSINNASSIWILQSSGPEPCASTCLISHKIHIPAFLCLTVHNKWPATESQTHCISCWTI